MKNSTSPMFVEEGESGRRARQNVPTPLMLSTSPSPMSPRMAWRTALRETPQAPRDHQRLAEAPLVAQADGEEPERLALEIRRPGAQDVVEQAIGFRQVSGANRQQGAIRRGVTRRLKPLDRGERLIEETLPLESHGERVQPRGSAARAV